MPSHCAGGRIDDSLRLGEVEDNAVHELGGWSVTQFSVLLLLPIPPQHELALCPKLGLNGLVEPGGILGAGFRNNDVFRWEQLESHVEFTLSLESINSS